MTVLESQAVITSFLIFGLYDISLLILYQKIYLILSLLLWICVLISYINKIVMLLFGSLNYKNLIVIWFSINVPALLSLCIAFIYDVMQLFKRRVPLLLLFFYAVVIYFAIKDYYNISLQVKITDNKKKDDIKNLKYTKIE